MARVRVSVDASPAALTDDELYGAEPAYWQMRLPDWRIERAVDAGPVFANGRGLGADRPQGVYSEGPLGGQAGA